VYAAFFRCACKSTKIQSITKRQAIFFKAVIGFKFDYKPDESKPKAIHGKMSCGTLKRISGIYLTGWLLFAFFNGKYKL